jgi:hypothetical protein
MKRLILILLVVLGTACNKDDELQEGPIIIVPMIEVTSAIFELEKIQAVRAELEVVINDLDTIVSGRDQSYPIECNRALIPGISIDYAYPLNLQLTGTVRFEHRGENGFTNWLNMESRDYFQVKLTFEVQRVKEIRNELLLEKSTFNKIGESDLFLEWDVEKVGNG